MLPVDQGKNDKAYHYISAHSQYGWDFFETEASKTYLKTSLEDDDKTESNWPSWRGAHDDDAHNRLMFPGSLSWHRIHHSNPNIYMYNAMAGTECVMACHGIAMALSWRSLSISKMLQELNN